MPGIIDCHSHIAVDGGVNEGSVSVSSMVGIEDVLDPEDMDIYRALAGGVTTSNILHGSANAIGGKNAVIKLRWGKDAQGLVFAGAPPGIKFALGENPKRVESAAAAAARTARYPAHAHGRRGRDPRGVHRGQGVPAARGTTTSAGGQGREAAVAAAPRPAGSSRWSRSSRASASCTRTPIAPTRS